MVDGNVVNFRHNTVISEGQGAIMNTGGTGAAKLNIQNNVLVGKPFYLTPTVLSSGHIIYNSTATVSYSGNVFWNVKNGQCPSGSVCQDPKLTSTNLAAFDATPQAGSPVVDKVPVIGGVVTDFVMAPRPSGAQADIGAYEVQAGGTTPPTTPPTEPAPTCTRAAPTLSLSGSSAAVAAGSTVNYTVNVRNNDSAACANTSFALARTVPTGWTGTMSASSLALAPGASGSATLQVTSLASAAAGGYGIGTGVSSAAGSEHTSSTSATYTVAPPAAPAPVTLTETLTLTKSVFKAGTKVSMTAQVLNAGKPVSGASVRFEAVKPNGIDKIAGTVTTDARGYAKWTFTSDTGPSSIGAYQAQAVATSGTATVTANATFQVK
jgi:hypothetical protein